MITLNDRSERVIVVRSFGRGLADGLRDLFERCLSSSRIDVLECREDRPVSIAKRIAECFVGALRGDSICSPRSVWLVDETVAGDWISFAAMIEEAEDLVTECAFAGSSRADSGFRDPAILMLNRSAAEQLFALTGQVGDGALLHSGLESLVSGWAWLDFTSSHDLSRHFVTDPRQSLCAGIRCNLRDEAHRSTVFSLYHDLAMTSGQLANRYRGNKRRKWFSDDLERWMFWFSDSQPVKALEVGDQDAISGHMLLEHIFPHNDSSVHTITDRTAEKGGGDCLKNSRLSASRKMHLYEGEAKEALAWMISTDGYWETFDFVLLNSPKFLPDLLVHATQSWVLLKPGGTMVIDLTPEHIGGVHPGRHVAGAFLAGFEGYLVLKHDGDRIVLHKATAEKASGSD